MFLLQVEDCLQENHNLLIAYKQDEISEWGVQFLIYSHLRTWMKNWNETSINSST